MSRHTQCLLMSRVACLVAVAALVVVPSSARSQFVGLHADFDLDNVGEKPSTDPPGDPDGDSLSMSEQGGTVRVQESFGNLNNKPAVVTRTRTGYSIYLAGLVDPDLRYCSSYLVSWRSLVDRSVQYFYMSFASSNNQILASVEYRSNGVHTVNSVAHQLSIGYTANVAQLFELELDVASKTLNLSIDGVPVPEAQGLSFVQIAPDGLRYIGTAFGLADLYSVAIDDLHVTASGCPGVPVERTSWGTLKGVYR
jgi:hypothetical protein